MISDLNRDDAIGDYARRLAAVEEKMSAVRRDRDRLRRWMRRWLHAKEIRVGIEGRGIAVDRIEIESALRGDAPPRRKP